LGKFVAFDLQDFSHELAALTVTADATLASGEYQRARAAHQCLMDGQRALKKKDVKTALALAEKAEALNPGFYQNATLLGRALLASGRNDEAAQSFKTALAGHPAFLSEKRELESLLQQARPAK